jgi:uncharacterized lipoprotein
MHKGLWKVVPLGMLAVGLSGCHTLHSLTHSCGKDIDGYTKATSVPSIRVPLGMDPPDTKSGLAIPALNEPAPPPRGPNDPCLEEPPKFSEPKGPRPPPAV